MEEAGGGRACFSQSHTRACASGEEDGGLGVSAGAAR